MLLICTDSDLFWFINRRKRYKPASGVLSGFSSPQTSPRSAQ